MNPGDTINPGEQTPQSPVPAPTVQSEVPPAPPVQEQPEAPQPPEPQWEYKDDSAVSDSGEAPARPQPSLETIEWTASEYVEHDKSAGWYMLLALASVAFAAVVYFITKEIISSVVIVIMGLAFGIFAARKPRELTYSLSSAALRVGDKSYGYGQFKSFTIVDEGAIRSITLMPLQRFMPPLSVYYAPEDEEKIANALSAYLPYVDRKPDMVDRAMRKVRF